MQATTLSNAIECLFVTLIGRCSVGNDCLLVDCIADNALDVLATPGIFYVRSKSPLADAPVLDGAYIHRVAITFHA